MPHPRYPLSPFQEGFAALGRDPALMVGELVWRWCFGFSAWALALTSIGLFLDSLPISQADEFLLSTLQPLLLSVAVHDIVRGSLLSFVWMNSLLLVEVTLLWSFAATAGRAATLRRLVELFRAGDAGPLTWQFRPIFMLQLLRASWSLAGVAAAISSVVLGMSMAQQQHAARAAFFLSFGVVSALVFAFVLNWFLGLAPLFCVRDNVGATEAIDRTADFCVARAGRLIALSLGYEAVWLVWAGTMTMFLFAVVSLSEYVAPGWIMLLTGLVALVYFAGADLLYLARLGAYAALAEESDQRSAGTTSPEGVQPSDGIASTQFPPAMEPA